LSIRIVTTGGTFDKIYFDALSEFKIGESMVTPLLEEANVSFEFTVQQLLRKDSLDMTDEDRSAIRRAVEESAETQILITHGTDTMVDSARELAGIAGKTIVFLGAMQPARMRNSDAMFNLGVACAAVQTLPCGIYIAMNGQIFDPFEVKKNRSMGRFEPIQS
jgi:L-asparaginase